MDFFEIFMSAIITLIIGIFTFLIFACSFTSKEFKGYYLNHEKSAYSIYINWDNRLDECVYRSYDGDKILEVYNKLKKEKCYGDK